MSHFLVEIPVPQSEPVDIERAAQTLRAARGRLCARATAISLVVAGVTIEDARLVCFMEADSAEAVQALVSLALLPGSRIRRLLSVRPPGSGSDRQGGNPRNDLVP